MLAGILAGDASEEQAQKRVGNTLTDLRAAVGEHLHVTREWVAFDRQRPHWIDVAEFEAQVARARSARSAHGARRPRSLPGRVPRRGERERRAGVRRVAHLAGERLRLVLAQALGGPQGVRPERDGRASPAAGIALARRLLELDPWNEDAHQALMALLARNGQRGAR